MTPEQLKASILQCAIQGKLVEQRPEEGNAEILYRQIQEEKNQLIKEGRIKKDKALVKFAEDEIPFDIPENWKWVRLSEICSIVTGKKDANFGSADGEYLFFTCAKEPIKCNSYSFEGESILVAGNGDIGNISYYDGQFEAYQRTYVIQPFIEHTYLNYVYYHIVSNWVKYNTDKMYGTAIQYIRLKNIQDYCIALPPLHEQHRIVNKIEELLPFVDRYAEAYEKLEQFNSRFPEEMKKAILQYAIMGKLVEQRLEEGTAEELYQQIQKEKQRLAKEGKIKKEKPLAEIAEDEIPFEIPETWMWCRLQDICSLIADVDHNMPKAVAKNNGKLFLSAKDLLDDGTINFTENVKYISFDDFDRLSQKVKPVINDIIYSRIGAALGKARVVEKEVEFIVSYSCCVVRTLIDAKFLRYYLESPFIMRHSIMARQSIGVPDLGMGEIKQYIVALPPLAEQHRIVAKIEELLPICERLR